MEFLFYSTLLLTGHLSQSPTVLAQHITSWTETTTATKAVTTSTAVSTGTENATLPTQPTSTLPSSTSPSIVATTSNNTDLAFAAEASHSPNPTSTDIVTTTTITTAQPGNTSIPAATTLSTTISTTKASTTLTTTPPTHAPTSGQGRAAVLTTERAVTQTSRGAQSVTGGDVTPTQAPANSLVMLAFGVMSFILILIIVMVVLVTAVNLRGRCSSSGDGKKSYDSVISESNITMNGEKESITLVSIKSVNTETGTDSPQLSSIHSTTLSKDEQEIRQDLLSSKMV